jgi:probable biosynthetic protein (TIGR04098 family)
MKFEYDLVLGLPHTNRGGLADHLLLAHAGHFQWTSIARAIGLPLSDLRTLSGGLVYGTFYFIEERFPHDRPISAFKLDDTLRFGVFLRAFKSMAVEGRIVFDHAWRVKPTLDLGESWPGDAAVTRHPTIRFGNIFITPERGNSVLRVAPPANADFSAIPPLPNEENPYQVTRSAEASGELGLFGPEWTRADVHPTFDVLYTIDADRDTNGAGLVYFANYVAFMDSAERRALTGNMARPPATADVAERALVHRLVAFYGNVDVDDAISTRVSLFTRPGDPRMIGVRTAVSREHDGRTICLSEAIKVLPERS